MDYFEKFYITITGSEGNYSNHPLDRGGKTIRGISKKYHPVDFEKAYYLWVNNYKEAFNLYVRSFYKRKFWNNLYDEIKDESLAFKLFDFGINASPKVAVKKLQQVINKHYAGGSKDVCRSMGSRFNDIWIRIPYLTVDGVFGKKTLDAVNKSYDYDVVYSRVSSKNFETKLYNYYVLALDTYYKNLSDFKTFGRGWLRRLRMIWNEGKLKEGEY